jgi:hypothetical protein
VRISYRHAILRDKATAKAWKNTDLPESPKQIPHHSEPPFQTAKGEGI